jgi:hypothetical protein
MGTRVWAALTSGRNMAQPLVGPWRAVGARMTRRSTPAALAHFSRWR